MEMQSNVTRTHTLLIDARWYACDKSCHISTISVCEWLFHCANISTIDVCVNVRSCQRARLTIKCHTHAHISNWCKVSVTCDWFDLLFHCANISTINVRVNVRLCQHARPTIKCHTHAHITNWFKVSAACDWFDLQCDVRQELPH